MKIETVIQMAKDVILKQGHHIPAVHVEFASGFPAYLLIPNIFSVKQDIQIVRNFFTAGAKLGREYPKENLVAIALVAEAWLTKRPSAPSSVPQQVEVLIATAMEFLDGGGDAKTSVHVIEMIRDGQGNLVDLLSWPEQDAEKTDTQLLASFAAGFESIKMTEDDKREIVAQEASKLGIDLSGEDIAKFVENMEDRNIHKFAVPLGRSVLRRKKKVRKSRGW